MSKLRLCALVLFVMLVPVVASATTIVTYDEATFLSGIASGYYLENFTGLGPYSGGTPTVSYAASSPGGLTISPFGSDSHSLSDLALDDVITFNFGSGVTAVGGWFTTVKNGKFNGGQITLTLDGTPYTPPNDPNHFVFAGFFSTTPITSLTLSAGNSGNKHLAVDKLYVGSAAQVVPPVAAAEPISMALAAGGFAVVALLRRRRSA
ncbi:MAG TPA: hypothetical protein VF767_10225 [Bryobacteraceae bacterium]